MKNSLGQLFILSLILVQIAACQNFNRKMTAAEQAKLDQEEYNRPNDIWPTNKDKNGDYYYGVSLNSFPGYLSENAGSNFITSKEKVGFLTMENGSWTTITGAVLNDEYHPIPDSLYVCWFSASEDKFYGGTFKMPTETLKKYFDEMWLTYRSSIVKTKAYKYVRYEDLIVGVAPGGDVTVWISAGSQQIEIGHYQAKQIEMAWEEFAGFNGHGEGSNRKDYLAASKDDITMPIPFGLAEKYREKFIWKPKILGFKNSVIEANRFDIYQFNAEIEWMYHGYKDKVVFEKRGVPKQVSFHWQVPNKTSHQVDVSFNEEDIYKAFDAICKDGTTEAELVLQLDEDGEIYKIVLRNKTHEYVLKPKEIKIYSGKFVTDLLPLKED